MSIIEIYFIIYTNFNGLLNCFYVFMILNLRHYVLHLDLSFLDAIVEVIGKAM